MQCLNYCRVSSEEQAADDHYSLGNQQQRATDLAKSKGWKIIRVEKDVASGKDTDRHGFGELVKAIKCGGVECVLVYRLDRLSRNVRDIYDFLDLIKTYDVAFVSITEGLDTTTAMGRAMLGVAAVFAQLAREMIAENVKDGLMRRAQAGLYQGNQSGPFGYGYSREKKTIEPVDGEARTVRHIFEPCAERKWGFKKITLLPNQDNIGTRINSIVGLPPVEIGSLPNPF